MSGREMSIRWLKFNAVGGIGIVVQLACLGILTSLGVNYLLATALAVEAAVIQNFFWHERFTWADRGRLSFGASVLRFAKFNMTTGAFSIVGNLVLMRLLAGLAHVPYLAANLVAVATCSIVNFMVSDRMVFRAAQKEHG
jgi:dolichol-phosphate mannosyltransferase